MMQNKNKFKTSLINLQSVQNLGFVIPSYQRPYVWGDVEIKKLLTDFFSSYRKNRNEEYYVGTILTKEYDNEAELIDGQQRFTTLWLVAFVLWTKKSESDLERIIYAKDNSLKLSFEIRDEISNHLQGLIDIYKDPMSDLSENDNKNKHPYLKNIARALSTIQSFIDEILQEVDLKDFGNYIYTKVCFVKNTTPPNIDLNKLFSTINSAGVQLEQTDIVKSNLLKNIDEKVLYSKIWEACEDMNNFFERSARISFPEPATNWSKINLTNLVKFNKDVFKCPNYECFSNDNYRGNKNRFSIDNLTLGDIPIYETAKKRVFNEEERERSQDVYCRSIINFDQLLLHAYRIHLKLEGKPDFEGTFHTNRIIEIFSSLNNPDEIKKFIKRLWAIRLLFDKYIIKWISDTNTKNETLELININRNSDSYYSRTPYEKTAMLMLQSLLYFMGDYLRQYWLTPYLYFLYQNHNDRAANSNQLLMKLEQIDNQLSLCNSMIDKEATYKMIFKELPQDFNFEEYLMNGNHGLKFKHYWFQKTEYVLWKNWKEDEKTSEFKNYRIVSRNSIEHIYPQKNAKIDDNHLHSFGNLVLLSVSQNSEYGRKPVSVKRSMFKEKKNTYDTLKSFLIFNTYDDWEEEDIANHNKEIIEILKQHYNHAEQNQRSRP